MIHTIIIDDEPISLYALGEKIRIYCPDLKVDGLFTRAEDALKQIETLKPKLVFLDIEMPGMNGFRFLEKLYPIDFEVIFTTAYSQYAIEALRIRAMDFLTKPIGHTELIASIGRLKSNLEDKSQKSNQINEQLRSFLDMQKIFSHGGKISIPIVNGFQFIAMDDIIKIKGENVYSVFFLADGRKITATLTLKEAEALLKAPEFFRVHKSYIVNIKYITRYIKGEGGTVLLTDGSEVEVSRRNKFEFLKRMTK